ncbi:hypothetical protein [Citreimonas salinaria]|uniref:Uncharacterized protein n=1 Tax=Citreimonas salinaria TaxID=321339 RepID=A0A1H3M2J6_9RHOB|nr:hypothetical protein [Citreimonas salinaria]SDY70245.1 hypothetical protein SAMN05444340_11542 [Citreimonas salinaria]
MTPIIYSAQIVDPTRDFDRCGITPGGAVDLREEKDGRIAILCQRRTRWFRWKRRAVPVGFLDQLNAELMKTHLAQIDSLRVRIVSASGPAKKPTAACISV